jgi:hypothetical protein
MDWVVGVLLNVTLGLRAEGPAAFGSSGRSPRMTTSFLCPGLVPGPRLGPGINPGHRSACARPPRIPQDQRYDISLRSACPENRFPLFGADLHTGTAGREASHRSVILCRCSARQPARKPLPPFRAHLALLVVEQLYSGLRPSRRSPYLDTGVFVLLPVRKHQSCAVRDPSGPGRCRVPANADRKALLLRASCETIRPDFENGNASHPFLRSR